MTFVVQSETALCCNFSIFQFSASFAFVGAVFQLVGIVLLLITMAAVLKQTRKHEGQHS